ncbi:hypothetical protein FKG94_27420 [Exilibacterium tricleocarpae]|uniref:Uncharacterized protein n=1 Tax=Exilibacterium tricleocarpae TaxID=2591008 RepID=A0A545SMS4_9GAMM|nr:hypothetical protein [Exilibacterium tricleocarpae]TQV66156.1 hypothetical protein FKG94_27420 [Exilibacterium tricleocarpae]
MNYSDLGVILFFLSAVMLVSSVLGYFYYLLMYSICLSKVSSNGLGRVDVKTVFTLGGINKTTSLFDGLMKKKYREYGNEELTTKGDRCRKFMISAFLFFFLSLVLIVFV